MEDGGMGFEGGIPGGFSEVQPADEAIQEICDKVKGQAEKKTGKNFHQFKAIQFRSQVVAGTNYLIKVHVGGQEFVHLSVHEELPFRGGGCVLTGLRGNAAGDTPLTTDLHGNTDRDGDSVPTGTGTLGTFRNEYAVAAGVAAILFAVFISWAWLKG